MAALFLRSSFRHSRFFKTVRALEHASGWQKVSPVADPARCLWSCSSKGNAIIMSPSSAVKCRLTRITWSQMTYRGLWGWLNAIFNKVDESRIKEVGPDRACAEWLLRCGAFVKWQNREQWTNDYNSLPASGGRTLKIEEIDATDSAIMHIGFPHFRGCKHIRRIVFHKAHYLEDTGMAQLSFLQDSLKELQVSSCGNVTVDGLRQIKKLKNLEYLLLYDLPEIRDKESMLKELQDALPNCAVVFPYAQPEDDPNLKTQKEKD